MIAGMYCGDSVLMGSDGLVSEENGLRQRAPKLWTRADPPLVFGFSGGEDVGKRFRDWFLEYRPEAWTWSAFARTGSEALATMNKERRERAERAGARVDPTDLVSVLVAGAIDGILDLREFTRSGDDLSMKDRPIAVLGAGRDYARAVYDTLMLRDEARDANTMAAVLEQTSLNAPMCDGPWCLFRVTRETVVEIPHEGGGWTGQPIRLLG